MKIRRIIVSIIGLLSMGPFMACSSGSSEDPVEESKTLPAKSLGVIPPDGETCTEYQAIPDEEVKVAVDFEWSAAQHADYYILVISEGGNELVRESYTTLEANMALARGKTYSWMVISGNKDGETVGNIYSFTTPGIQLGNYAPYPAAISVEFEEETSMMAVSWIGSDEDGDGLVYDVFISLAGNLIFDSTDLSETSVEPLTFIPFAEYSIKVISRDSFGNSSTSQLVVSSQ